MLKVGFKFKFKFRFRFTVLASKNAGRGAANFRHPAHSLARGGVLSSAPLRFVQLGTIPWAAAGVSAHVARTKYASAMRFCLEPM